MFEIFELSNWELHDVALFPPSPFAALGRMSLMKSVSWLLSGAVSVQLTYQSGRLLMVTA